MAYTTVQLETLFQNANMGEAPNAATQLLLATYAGGTADGSLTDSQALLDALHVPPPANGSAGSNTPESTTDVALAVYQFFAGRAPSEGGLSYLVNGGGNPNDLDSAYYAGFNQANRYYNFAINLITGNAAAAESFQSAYGPVTFDQAVATAYMSIVGTPYSQAAAAIASVEAAQSYFATVASEIAPTVNQDLATKAIAIAYILEEAVKADVGNYASAIDQFDTGLATGAAIPGLSPDGIDLLTAFLPPPLNDSGSGSTITLSDGQAPLTAVIGSSTFSVAGATADPTDSNLVIVTASYGLVELFGNASAGHTDVVTGGDADVRFHGTGSGMTSGSGGNTEISLGNGVDDIYLYSGINTVSLGNGANDYVQTVNSSGHISLGDGAGDIVATTGGNSTITLGNGAGDHVTIGSIDTVTLGTGAGDRVDFSNSPANVTFQGPSALADFDSGQVAVASFATPTTTSQAEISTSNLNVVSGLVAGDQILLPHVDSLAMATNLAGVAAEAVFTAGVYNAGAGTFTESLSGHDALLTYDSGGSTFVSVVLVGAAAEIGHSTVSGETITF
jgi:S-layer protein